MVGEENQNHLMILQTTHESGAEEWYCPTCGRRFVMQWPPVYKKIVLVTGSESVSHHGGKGGLHIGPPQVSERSEKDLEIDSRLTPWSDWLDKSNFNTWWGEN